MREYTIDILVDLEEPEYNDEVYVVDRWHEIGMWHDWGTGYWAKDGKRSNDDIFTTPQEDATHVVWYNK